MLIRLGLATAFVVTLYLLVTLMRGEPETNTKATNDYMPSSAQSSSMSDKMNDKMADRASVEIWRRAARQITFPMPQDRRVTLA
jgi:hypothetical protein